MNKELNKDKTPIHKRIIYFRKLRGFNQGEMAKKLKMSQGNYGKIERGDIGIMYSYLEKFADICKISVATLVSEREDELDKIIAEKDKQIVELQQQVIQLLKGEK